MERGKNAPSFETLDKIAKRLRIPVAALFDSLRARESDHKPQRLNTVGCKLCRMAVEELRNYQRRHARGAYFADLRPEQRHVARMRLEESKRRARTHGKPITPRRLGSMVASASRLARMTRAQLSAWGRRMRAKQGGYGVQRRYKARGMNPTQLLCR
jgi:hypothetical protein